MVTELNVVNTNELSEPEKNDIDREIDQIIDRHKNNRYEINKLVFESVSALTESNYYSKELSSQGVVKRFWGGITGNNRKLQEKIDSSLAASQYASQQTLQKLAEQNLMSFELITAVNNKLNASIVQVEHEINKVYGTLVTFFKQTKSDIIQLENRVERIERNVNLLNWQNSIEYQMWNGVEYAELDDVAKIICLVRDFYDITKGSWTTSDLLLLKAAMSTIGIMPKEKITYRRFIIGVSCNPILVDKLFDGTALAGIEKYPEYVAITAGIQKRLLLEKEEKYLVDNTIEVIRKHSCEVSEAEVKDDMMHMYERDKARINVDADVDIYDFILEMLYNLEEMKNLQNATNIDNRLKEAEMLFSVYETGKLIPLLEELMSYGVVKAKYMMALLYETGCSELERDDEKCDQLLDECITSGYLPAKVRRVLPSVRNGWGEEVCKTEFPLIINNLENMAEEDSFAAEECARVYINPHYIGLKEKREECYKKAIEYFKKAPSVFGYYGIAMRYINGDGVEKDLSKALEYLMKSAKYDYSPAVQYVGYANENNWTPECSHKDAGKWYKRAYKLGNHKAITNLAWCYSKDDNEYGMPTDFDEFFRLSMEAYELGDMPAWGIGNIGWAYQYGKGTDIDLEKAKKFYQEAAEMGNEWSKGKLEDLLGGKVL